MLTKAIAHPGSPEFFAVFAATWVGVNLVLALLSGWLILWFRFPGGPAIQGRRFRFVSGSMGMFGFPARFSRVLFVSVGPKGIRLNLLFLFRLFSPPIMIPWSAVESVTERKLWFFRRTVIHIEGSWLEIRLQGEAAREVRRQFQSLKLAP